MTMRRTDNGTGPAPPQAQRVPADQLLPDLALYERLIGQGVADAHARGSPVDHVTARRLAIWLAARPQEPSFTRGLALFINTGVIPRELKNRLRIHARSATYFDQPEAARLMQYCTARGTDLGPVAHNFGATCHQMDRADLMLADLRHQNRHGTRQSSPDTGDPLITILARRDPDSQITTLILDSVTADVAIYAIAAHAEEREAHLRQVQLSGQNLPGGSCGRTNRELIADRETRIAARLRAVEHEYHAAIERDAARTSPELTGALHAAQPISNREIELG
jgi:hypothetical protein